MVFEVVKKDDSQHIVYGWGSVVVQGGELVTDRQGDQIDPPTLEKAVVEFMLGPSASGVMHEGVAVAKVIASFITTPEIMNAFFGPSIGAEAVEKIPVGWIIGVKVFDAATWQRVVTGELTAFSIQGTADPVELAA